MKIVEKYLYYSMGCSNCKNSKIKNEMDEKFKKKVDLVENYVIVFVIVWSLLALYGIFSLFNKFL